MPDDFVFYSSDETNEEIDLPIKFDPVIAGEKEKRTVFLENVSKGSITFNELEIEDNEEVSVERYTDNLNQEELGKVVLVFEPNLTDNQPVKAQLNIDYDLMIE